jgi:glycosyltransferase involved in cell wall biosynthesis
LLRVAHVVPSIAERTGGPAASVLQTALALNHSGVHAEVFTTDMGSAASARHMTRLTRADLASAAGVPVHVARAQQPYRLAYAPSLRTELGRRARDFDVIHIHSLFLYPSYAAFAVASQHHVPYVVSLRGMLDPYLRRRGRIRKAIADALWQRRMLTGAATIHLTSRRELELVSDVAPRVPRAVIPNPVDCTQFDELPAPTVFSDRYLGGHAGSIVMYLGRISHKKGIEHLIRAFAKIAADHSDASLAIIGPDDENLTPRLRQLAQDLGISSRTAFVGHLSGRDKLAALAAATVWVLPSATENFGVAVVEALAAGVAVIVSPGVNIASDLADAGACVICEPETGTLASAISSLLRDPIRRSHLGAAGRIAARGYSPDVVASQMTHLYETILSPLPTDK